MELSTLTYTGHSNGGHVVVRQEHTLSPFRKIQVFPGKSWRIGKDIPKRTADYIMEMRSDLFEIKTIEVSDAEYLEDHLKEVLSDFGENSEVSIPKVTLSVLINVFGDAAQKEIDAMASKKEPKKTKTRSRRSTPPNKK